MSLLAADSARSAGALEHLVIRASAGSGKTHQLTTRYLQLIAAGAEPSSILATTFTRLAAGEIRDRILRRLAAAANDPQQRAALARELTSARTLARDDVMAMLVGLAGAMHRMQVRTLDSFFASIVRAFAIELEMPLAASIIDEEDARALRNEAVRLMLDEHDPQRLVDLLRLLTEGKAERGVTRAIDEVVEKLYSLWREAGDEPWDCVPELPGMLSPPQVTDTIQRLEALGDSLPAALVKPWVKDCEHVLRRSWRAFVEQGISCKIAAADFTYFKQPLPQFVIDAYLPLVEHARATLVGRVRDQTLATRDLLGLFHHHYEALKHRRRVVTFADLTAAMARAESLGAMDEIGFRLDATLHHVLLDEFQDTSIAQWRALEPLAQEMISHLPPARSFFCVGDAKQSIYGWRDAAPEVLDELPRLLAHPDGGDVGGVEARALAMSWRSAQPVIDVVNRVFGSLRGNAALDDDADAAEAWSAGFTPHTIAERNRGMAGYVELRTAADAPKEKREQVRFAAAADLVTDLHGVHPELSIAVLTRTNDAVARMLYELGPSRRQVAASGRGGGPLTDAAPVNAILDLLQLADHPDDTAAAFHVAGSPLGAALEFTEYRNPRARRRLARRVRRQLLERGYQSAIAEWTAAIAPACDGRELRRLMQLVELAGAFDPRRGLRPGGFIAVVEQKLVADAQPAPVQVMTIHQAKGLEFDAVVLPELDEGLRGQPPPVVFERAGDTGPITRVCRYMKGSVRQFVPELDPLFERHRRRAVREALSLLYVAMTRAKQGLYMIIDPPAEKSAWPKTAAGLLRAALAPDQRAADEILFQHGETGWSRSDSRHDRRSEVADTDAPVSDSGALDVRVGSKGTSKSEISDLKSQIGATGQPQPLRTPQSVTLAPSRGPATAALLRGRSAEAASAAKRSSLADLKLPSRDAREQGIALHALFEQVEWLEDFALDDAALVALVRAALPRRDESWARQRVEAFRRMLDRPGARAALSHSIPAAGALRHVQRERPFARLTDAGVQAGRIDRLVIEHDEDGNAIAATIIDFKPDIVEDAQIARALAERYRPQMEAYRAAAVEMLGLPSSAAEGIRMVILFIASGETAEL